MKLTPELILKSEWVLQDKDENVLEDEYCVEEDDGQNGGNIFQVKIEVADVMGQRTVNVPHQIHFVSNKVNFIKRSS